MRRLDLLSGAGCADSTVMLYCAGTNGNVYRFVTAWSQVSGVSSVVRIASGPVYNHPEYGTDVIWVVGSDGSVRYTVNGTSWFVPPKPKLSNGTDGPAKDIAVGLDGSVWIVGGDSVGGGNAIYIWNEQAAFGTAPVRNQWQKVPGGATNLTVDRWGRPWIVNNVAAIWQRR